MVIYIWRIYSTNILTLPSLSSAHTSVSTVGSAVNKYKCKAVNKYKVQIINMIDQITRSRILLSY